MKKLLLLLVSPLFLLFTLNSAFALITTDNVDVDRFQYQTPYKFATSDLAANMTAKEMAVEQGQTTNEILYYTISRGGSATVQGRIVGLSVAGNIACTSGAATFDVTINGTVTGVQTVIEPAGIVRSAIGTVGSSAAQFAYIRQDRLTSTVSQGFRAYANRDNGSWHNADNPYGIATPLSAGNRIGVKVTTSSGFAAGQADYVVVVYVLE